MRGSKLLRRELTIAPISLAAISCSDGLCWQPIIGVVLSLGKAMRRRNFIKGIAGSATAWPLASGARPTSYLAQVPKKFGNLLPPIEVHQAGGPRYVILGGTFQQRNNSQESLGIDIPTDAENAPIL